MRFLIISILLNVTFLVGYSADSIGKMVSTLEFNSEAYQEFFQYAESKGINSHDLKQNFRGLSTGIISNIMNDEGINSNIREIIENTINILNIPTYVRVQETLSKQDFERLNTLIINVITIHYKAAFAAQNLSNDSNEPPFGYEAGIAIMKYNNFINGLDNELHKKTWLRLLTPAQLGL